MTDWNDKNIVTKVQTPTCDDFVRRAQTLVPKLRERAVDAERARRLPDETIADFFAADLHKIMQPKRFGGYGLGHDIAVEVVQTIASGCGSSGWLMNLAALHNWHMGLFPLEAQEEYWADSQDVFSATASFSPAPTKLEPASGGFRLSGRWKFASGADFAQWFFILISGDRCYDWFMVPRKDVVIVDDWFVSGLCATGSKDVLLNEVFVPAHRVLDFQQLMTGRTPGAFMDDASPYNRVPLFLPAVWGIPAALIGMTIGITEAFQETLRGKTFLLTGEKQSERVVNQIMLAEAQSGILAAQLMMRHHLKQIGEWGRTDSVPAGAEALTSQRDAAYVARLMANTATKVAILAGANSTSLKSPIQRFLRDINVGVTHISMAWEDNAEKYGRAKWGLPPKAYNG